MYVGETINLSCIADRHNSNFLYLYLKLEPDKSMILNLSKNNDSKTASVELMFQDTDIGIWLCHCIAGSTTLSSTILYVERKLSFIYRGLYPRIINK